MPQERLSAEPYLKSIEDDPELLLYIPFTEAVAVRSIPMRSVTSDAADAAAATPTRHIKIFSNRDDLDFEAARAMKPQCELNLLPPDHYVEGTLDYPLRPASRFQNISSITVLFMDNYAAIDEGDGDDSAISTIVTYVRVKGKGSGQKRMAVETVYESRGMQNDHQVKGEFSNQAVL